MSRRTHRHASANPRLSTWTVSSVKSGWFLVGSDMDAVERVKVNSSCKEPIKCRTLWTEKFSYTGALHNPIHKGTHNKLIHSPCIAPADFVPRCGLERSDRWVISGILRNCQKNCRKMPNGAWQFYGSPLPRRGGLPDFLLRSKYDALFPHSG